jgi:hypothetical protein
MSSMKIGHVVGVQCTVQPGPFSEERLITFNTVHGPVSGFVSEEELKRTADNWFVRAVVEAVRGDILEVRVNGSFFTTNGLASVSKEYAIAA